MHNMAQGQFVAQADRAFVDDDYTKADKLYAKARLQRNSGPQAYASRLGAPF